MAIVKLALSGLDGIETSRVKMGAATVIYDRQAIQAGRMVAVITEKTPFRATLISDAFYDPEKEEKIEECKWYRLKC